MRGLGRRIGDVLGGWLNRAIGIRLSRWVINFIRSWLNLTAYDGSNDKHDKPKVIIRVWF